MKNRNKISYFEKTDGTPAPVTVEITRRARFSEVDAMGIVWNGRYPGYFEEAASELGRIVGLSYGDYYTASLRAPIVKLHVDYFKPIFLDEEFTIRGSLIWHEGSRLNTEFVIIKKGGSIAAFFAMENHRFLSPFSLLFFLRPEQAAERFHRRSWLPHRTLTDRP